jgi:hypothetical protein
VLVDAVEQFATERLAGVGVSAFEDRFEAIGYDVSDESEFGRLLAGPPAGKLAAVLGEVAAVVGSGCAGSASEQRRHPDHVDPRPPAGTCLRGSEL